MKWPALLAVSCLPFLLLAAGLGRALAAPVQDAGLGGVGDDALWGLEASHQIAELEWMSGVWQGSGLGGAVEEHWSHPAGGTMMGMLRLVQQDATSFTQFMLIEERKGRVTLRFHHFNPGLEAWEKDGALGFELVDCRHGRATFESPNKKQTPSRMVWSLRDEDGLGCLIESPEALGGPLSFEVLYKRVDRER